MRELCNLVVDLDERFGSDAPNARPATFDDAAIAVEDAADERLLAWIDDEFGGYWSSEARAGGNVVARRAGAPVGFATFDAQGLRFRWLRGLARERGVGLIGPLGVAAKVRGGGLGAMLVRQALAALRARGYARALIGAVGADGIPFYAQAVGARVAERFVRRELLKPRPRVVVMASGNGSNLQAVLDRVEEKRLPITIAGVVVNDPQARAIERARRARVPSVAVLPWKRREETRADYDTRLRAAVGEMAPDLVLLLGWMHLLDDTFVETFPQLLNLHPAFLPLDETRDAVTMPDGAATAAFRGAHAVRDALAAGSTWTGATVHAVTPFTDRGPVVARKPLPVTPGETEADVMRRLHPIEYRVVATGIRRWLFERPS